MKNAARSISTNISASTLANVENHTQINRHLLDIAVIVEFILDMIQVITLGTLEGGLKVKQRPQMIESKE